MLKKMAIKRCYLTCFLVYLFLVAFFVGSGYLFDILTLILAPLGLQAFANETSLVSGVWLRPLRLYLFQE